MGDELRFNFNEEKATAAASHLLDLEGGTMDYMRLVKLLYFADREGLKTLGQPVTGGDQYFSLDQGPILSQTLDLCKLKSRGVWSEHIERVGLWAVTLRRHADLSLGPLSEAEMAVLKKVSDDCRGLDQWALSKISHRFPEYRDPQGSRVEILPIEILRAVGKTDSEIEDILEDERECQYIRRIIKPA